MKLLLQKYANAFPELRADDLLLRRLAGTDAAELYETFSDEEVMKYYNASAFTSQEQVRQMLGIIEQHFNEGMAIRWAITKEGKALGTIGLSQAMSNPFGAEIGFELHRSQWGKGIITKAIGAVKEFGLGEFGLQRIQARTKPENIASWRALERSGFEREGLLRKQSYWKNELHDVYLYAVINN